MLLFAWRGTPQVPAATLPATAPAPQPAAARAAATVRQWRKSTEANLPAELNRTEDAASRISIDVLNPLTDVLRNREAASFTALLAANGTCAAFPHALPQPWRSLEGISEVRWGKLASASPAAASQAMGGYLGQFQRVDHAALDVFDARLTEKGAELRVAYDLRGLDRQGQRRQDRGFLLATCTKSGDTWKISAMSVEKMETLTSAAAFFTDRTQASGLGAMPIHERIEAIRRGGYALAIADYDGDNRPDVYVGAWGEGHLYRNVGEGRFEDVTASAGLRNDKLVKAAAFVDIRNSGHKDLVLTRFVDGPREAVVVYENDGKGHFTVRPNAVQQDQKYDRPMPMTVVDLNHDGRLDLFVGFPGARDFTSTNDAQTGLATQGVFMNHGDGTFGDNTAQRLARASLAHSAASFPTSRSVVTDDIFPHAMIAATLDNGKAQNILVVDDRRNGLGLYRQAANGRLEPTRNGIANDGWGMGVAISDYDGDGLQDVFVTNVDLLAARRVAKFLPGDMKLFNGNHLFRNLGNGKFEDVTAKAGLDWAGEGAGGCVWIDYNRDGNPDLFVMNGLWSGSGREDLSSLFVRNFLAQRKLKAMKKASDTTDPRSALEVLTSFRGPLDDSRTPANAMLSMGGHQRGRLYRNNGNGTFTDVAFMAGVDLGADGYVPAVADVDGDGRADLVLRNADPGSKRYPFPCVEYLHNDCPTPTRGLALQLQGDGKTSNRDAVGAMVEVWTGEKRQVREIQSLSGAAMSEQVAYVGLGSAERADKVLIRWPSGRVQNLGSMPAGRWIVHENQDPRQVVAR